MKKMTTIALTEEVKAKLAIAKAIYHVSSLNDAILELISRVPEGKDIDRFHTKFKK